MRIGLISAANITPSALLEPARDIPGVTIAAVAARSRDRAEAFAAEHGIERVVSSYEELCRLDDLDAVYIATPAALHLRWTLEALSQGKHVLCEKPFAANASEAIEMVEAGKRANRVLMEAYHWRYHPMADLITEKVATLGAIREISAEFNVGIIPPTDIRFDLSIGGGSLMDLGVYPVQWVRHVAKSEPTVVNATAKESPAGIDITMNAELRFGASTKATIACSMEFGIPFDSTLSVVGELGELHVSNPLAPQRGNSIRLVNASGEHIEEAPLTTTYFHQLQAFIAAVESGAAIPTGGVDSISTMQCVDSIYRAAGLQPRPSLPR
jgi:predicted dehydrogenase